MFLIGSVQAAITMRKHATSPSEMEEWYPQYFRESEDPGDLEDDHHRKDGTPKAVPSFWKADIPASGRHDVSCPSDGWKHRRVGRRWYGAQRPESIESIRRTQVISG
jgi:hypothetical protein